MLSALQAFRQGTARANFNGKLAERKKIMTQSTYSRKSREPKKLTCEEIQKLDKDVHFTDEELLAFVRYRNEI